MNTLNLYLAKIQLTSSIAVLIILPTLMKSAEETMMENYEIRS